MSRSDRHNEIEINLLRSGSLTYLLGGRRTTIPVGRLAAFWAAIPHQIVDFDRKDPYFVLPFIMGATMILERTGYRSEKIMNDHRKGLDWFRVANASAYMVLLD